ncbi:hypothetical protein [Pseudoduganella violacea]|uniref:Tetratricopeptide repeat protein n=1 Tax=Pseudoduganella violacea TaxID=1715466 RepID=A0A7W5FWW4_9BURK|nr:hypothetical protein [Pseudoduganella violacea]MBB3122227.1 hypothetical protein [Pseudoduganella violacea]
MAARNRQRPRGAMQVFALAALALAASGPVAAQDAGAARLPAAGWQAGVADTPIPTQSSAVAEQETGRRLAALRQLPLAGGEAAAQVQRRQLDNNWRYFGDNRSAALPVLRRELAAELRKARPQALLLLESGYFLRQLGESADRALAMQALLALDASDPAIAQNSAQLFRFVHLSAQERDARLLPLIDKFFLRGKVTVFIPQQGFTLDETSVCVFLYGQYGRAGEAHLRALLGDAGVANKVLEVLIWTGSPDSVPAVAALLQANRDADTFSRALSFLLRSGGPQGRDALLAFDPRQLEGKPRQFYEQIQPQLRETSFATLREQLDELPASPSAGGKAQNSRPRLDDAGMRQRLIEVYEHYGRYENVQPAEIAAATLPAEFLIGQITRIRERSFLRVTGEALSEIDMSNTLLNTLRYRPDAAGAKP